MAQNVVITVRSLLVNTHVLLNTLALMTPTVIIVVICNFWHLGTL